jgi:hypothetical protein
MGNAIEDALNRAGPEQRARNQQIIEEARRNIKLVSMQQMDDISPTGADAIARNAQIIEEAKRTIPFETMQDVDSIGPPLNTPSMKEANPKVIQLNAGVQSNIESIEQGDGNNYLRENAVDRAMARQSSFYGQSLEAERGEQQQAMGR